VIDIRWNHWANSDYLERRHFWRVTDRVLWMDSTSNLGHWARGEYYNEWLLPSLEGIVIGGKARGTGLCRPAIPFIWIGNISAMRNRKILAFSQLKRQEMRVSSHPGVDRDNDRACTFYGSSRPHRLYAGETCTIMLSGFSRTQTSSTIRLTVTSSVS
jgi:hypothetical protein